MNNTIKCTHCGKQIEVSEALRHQIQEEVSSNLSKKHQQELEKAKEQVANQVRKKFEEQSALELKDLKNQLEEKNKKMDEFRDRELELRADKRKIEEEKKDLALELDKRLSEEKKKIEDKIYKEVDERQKLKDAEKEKIIADLKKAVEEMRRKAEQGSQQLQGEVLELDVEETLKNAFPSDSIAPVEKGIKGADIRQTVKTSRGNECGVILWETKRTKNWQDSWIEKLKADQRSEGAHISVIISQTLPEVAQTGMGFKNGVWIVGFSLILPLAQALRDRLWEVAKEKFDAKNKGERAEIVYEYIRSHEFKQQIEAMVEAYQEMKSQIDQERRAFERIWTKREAQINKVLTSTAKVYGSIEGRVGRGMPQIKGLDLPELDDGKEG